MKEKYIAQYKNKNEFFKGNTSDVLGTKTLYASLKSIIKDTYNYYFETKDRDFILTLAVNNGDYIIETIVWENGGIVEENPKETFITEVFDEKKEKFISIPDGIIDVTGYSKNGAEATAENLYRKINSTYPESGVDNEDDTFYDLPEPNIQYGIYFELEDGDEISVEDGDYDFQKYYNTEEEALAAMKKILKDPKVKADRNIVGIHSVFLVDEDEWDEDPEGNYDTYGYEPYELVDRIDKEDASEVTIDEDGYEDETILLDEQYESNKKTRTEQEWEDELEDDNSEIFHTMNGLQSVLDSEEYPSPEVIYSYMDEIYDLFIQGKDKELDHVIRKAKSIIETTLEESFKSKDKYSVLREALDRLDREDNKGKKSKVRAQVRNLRSKLK